MRNDKGQFVKGITPHNKKPDIFRECANCKNSFLVNRKNPSTKCCSKECGWELLRGVPKAAEHVQKMRDNNARYWLGKKQSREHVQKATKGLADYQSGKKHWNWQGGITPELKKLRHTAEYRSWRTAVFQRDDYTCVLCGTRGGQLNADHIKPFARLVVKKEYDKITDIDNGRTLCEQCHRRTSTYGPKGWRINENLSSSTN